MTKGFHYNFNLVGHARQILMMIRRWWAIQRVELKRGEGVTCLMTARTRLILCKKWPAEAINMTMTKRIFSHPHRIHLRVKIRR